LDGEVVANKMVGEIDMYDLMKAALRQRPEYIIVGEIRGKEAYVLFQAMATGHATYSTVHADSAKSLIHRLEGKPIEIPRVMLQSLDIVSIHITTRVKGNRVRRCKQIIEIIDIDPTTKEILTNEVFRWDPIEDKFIYTGKSYILEGIRASWDLTKEEITKEIRNRTEILEWMRDNDIRTYQEVAKAVSRYSENPDDFLKKMRHPEPKKKKDKNKDKKGSGSKKKKTEKLVEESPELSNNISVDQKELQETPVIQLEEKQDGDKPESDVELDDKINAFKDMESIDNETAVLLYDNGFASVDNLNNVSRKELIKIKGIKRKTAKKIIKELNDNISVELSQASDEGGNRGAT